MPLGLAGSWPATVLDWLHPRSVNPGPGTWVLMIPSALACDSPCRTNVTVSAPAGTIATMKDTTAVKAAPTTPRTCLDSDLRIRYSICELCEPDHCTQLQICLVQHVKNRCDYPIIDV